MAKQIFMKQDAKGHDQSSNFPRVIIANAMIMLRLELVAMTPVRNEPCQSLINPVERAMGAASIGLSVLAMYRELATVPEIEI